MVWRVFLPGDWGDRRSSSALTRARPLVVGRPQCAALCASSKCGFSALTQVMSPPPPEEYTGVLSLLARLFLLAIFTDRRGNKSLSSLRRRPKSLCAP